MKFAEHTKRNWLITLFAALFLAGATTMLFLDNPHNTIVIISVFLASAVVFFAVVLGIWHLVQKRATAKGKKLYTS